jgi:hypothetical protein
MRGGSPANVCHSSIIHFTLFVFACIATHKWRKAQKQPFTERRNIELQYHQSPEAHMEQQPPAYRPSAAGSTKTSTGEEENPFKDQAQYPVQNDHENPLDGVEHSAVKYV